MLCTGEKGVSPTCGIPLHYKGTRFHKIKCGYLAFGGDLSQADITSKLTVCVVWRVGSGGESVYGDSLPDENFELKHDDRGILAMATKRPNQNTSEFTISFCPTKSLNGKTVVFGQLLKGDGVLREIELVQPTMVNDKAHLFTWTLRRIWF